MTQILFKECANCQEVYTLGHDAEKCNICGGKVEVVRTSNPGKRHKYGVNSTPQARTIYTCLCGNWYEPLVHPPVTTRCDECECEMTKVVCDSMRERTRALELLTLQRAGEISNLVIHPKYLLIKEFEYRGEKERATCYEADYAYTEGDEKVIEDVKGGTATQTPLFKMKWKMMKEKMGDEYDLRITQ